MYLVKGAAATPLRSCSTVGFPNHLIGYWNTSCTVFMSLISSKNGMEGYGNKEYEGELQTALPNSL